MSYIVELVLSELGKKVCGTDKKVFYVNDVNKEDITSEYIEEHLFPIISTKLVEHTYIYKSFMDCESGEYLKAKKGNEEFLMKFERRGWVKDTFVARRVDGGYHEAIEFHANGVERTRCKNKIVLSMCTPEEVEEIKKRLITKPLVEALEMIANNIPGVTIDKDKIVLPAWMDEYRAIDFYEIIANFIN